MLRVDVLGQDLTSDSLEVSEVAEVCTPFLLRGGATDKALGVGMRIEELIDKAREPLGSSGCRRQNRRKRVHVAGAGLLVNAGYATVAIGARIPDVREARSAWEIARRNAAVGKCVVSRRVRTAVATAGWGSASGTKRTPGTR
jgi:hypothetical protein